jgi:hypothetical protein
MAEYDQSEKPVYSPVTTGDGVSSQSTSSKVSVVQAGSIGRGFWTVEAPSQNQKLLTYTIQICVNGTPMSLDVYASGQPY